MSELKQKIQIIVRKAIPYLRLAHLMPTPSLLLPLAPVSGALVLAYSGVPSAGVMIGLLFVALSLWSIAWGFNDLSNALRKDETNSLILKGVLAPNQALVFLGSLTLLTVIVILLLNWRLSALAPVALLVVFGFPWLRRRSFLVDAWAGLGAGWIVPMAIAASGHWPDKVGALLGVVTLLWVTGWSVLYQWPRHTALMERGMRSLGMMFGTATGHLVIALQISVLLGGWMAGTEAKFGTLYKVALLVAAALMVWQALLIHRQSNTSARTLQLHLASGAVLWLGVILHFAST